MFFAASKVTDDQRISRERVFKLVHILTHFYVYHPSLSNSVFLTFLQVSLTVALPKQKIPGSILRFFLSGRAAVTHAVFRTALAFVELYSKK